MYALLLAGVEWNDGAFVAVVGVVGVGGGGGRVFGLFLGAFRTTVPFVGTSQSNSK